MATSYPDVYPNSENWQCIPNNQSFESELDGSEQTASLSGDKWAVSQTFGNVSKVDGNKLKAFVVSLRGKAGKALLVPFEARDPQGTTNGTPVISGASQTGSTLTTSNWAANETVLMAGDYIETNGELKMIMADVVSDGGGLATLTFEPALRTSPPDAQAIITENPRCIMRLLDDEQASWQLSVEKYYTLTLDWVEAY